MAFYRKKVLQGFFAWIPSLPMELVSISAADVVKGSPKQGDMIGYNPANYTDFWLVEAQYFKDTYEWVSDT